MSDDEIMKQWKKNSVVIGSSTNVLATLTSFIPIIWLCTTYDCWPPISTVLVVQGIVAAFFGVFYLTEPVSYYAALGVAGTYLSFLPGNIGNMRVPCMTLALDATHSIPDTTQTEVISTMAICDSIVTNLIDTTSAAIVGEAILSVLPEFIAVGLTKYASSAIFRVTFGNFTVKCPKVAILALAIPVILKMTTGPPATAVIMRTVLGILLIAGVFYKKEFVK